MEGMTIKEAAKKLEVEAHVLRYWEDELGLEIKRNELGHRYYDERDIKLFREVKAMKAQGLALKDIRNAIIKYNRGKTKKPVAQEQSSTDKLSENKASLDKQSMNKTPIDRQLTECPPADKEEIKEDELKVVDFKQAQLQAVMNKIVANALRENKDIITTSIKKEITTDVMRQFDTVMREKEEKEEARFRRLDEVLRQMQRANAEVAATKTKKRLFRRG